MLSNKTLWWTLLVGWIIGSIYWHVCKIKNLCDVLTIPSEQSAASETNIPVKISKPLHISDSSQLDIISENNFRFKKSDFTVNYSGIRIELDSLTNYLLAQHGNKRVIIAGSYSPAETNHSTFPNLGIARANEVKNILTKAGIVDSVLSLKSLLDTTIVFNNDTLTGGITFAFENKPLLTELDLANAEKYESIFKPMNLYFPTASAQYIITTENQKFLMAAKQYLLNHLQSKLLLIGHTDNEDSAEWNLILSKKRALSVKRQFSKAGVAPDRIFATGKGESMPKASNETVIGKKANRRVTIVVQ
jgi:OOP family OmpA-OmpF porin